MSFMTMGKPTNTAELVELFLSLEKLDKSCGLIT
jgi:hypothetical protein